MGECGACEDKLNITINITIEGDFVYEDQCTYVEHVYMDDDGGIDLDFDIDSDE